MLRLLIVILTLAASVANAAPRETRNQAYGPDKLQRYDVYWDDARKDAPMIVMLHGGGWRRGDKTSGGVVEPKASHWKDEGFIFVSVNTRLLPTQPHDQARDFADAIADIQKKALNWGGDPRNVILMGHSAGAHIAALVGASRNLQRRAGITPLRGVVSIDTEALDLVALMRSDPIKLFHDAFGSDPAYWAGVSPLVRIERGATPILAVCSTRRRGPCGSARALAQKARGVGASVSVLPVPLRHAPINRDLGKPGAYTDAVTDWIEKHLR